MTNRPIEQPGDAEFQGMEAALQRAAQRARERARATGTRLVVSKNGVLEFIPPENLAAGAESIAAERAIQSVGKD